MYQEVSNTSLLVIQMSHIFGVTVRERFKLMTDICLCETDFTDFTISGGTQLINSTHLLTIRTLNNSYTSLHARQVDVDWKIFHSGSL